MVTTRESQSGAFWARRRRQEREMREARTGELFVSPPDVALEQIASIKAKLKAQRPDLSTEDQDFQCSKLTTGAKP